MNCILLTRFFPGPVDMHVLLWDIRYVSVSVNENDCPDLERSGSFAVKRKY